MLNNKELKPELLCTRTDPGIFSFTTTDELQVLDEVIGQARAIGAIEFGAQIRKRGFNLFVLGPSGCGKQSIVIQHLSLEASTQKAPFDWCYVNNFEHHHMPVAIRLPAGKGYILREDVQKLISDSKISIPIAFESDEYRAKLQEIQDNYQSRREEALKNLADEAAEHGVALVKGPHGFVLGPIVEGKKIDIEEFSKLSGEKRRRINETIEIYEEKLSALLRRMPQLAREENEEIETLNRSTVIVVVDVLMHDLFDKYSDYPEVCRYLNNVKNDIARHIGDFTERRETVPVLGLIGEDKDPMRRYEVNLLIDNRESKGAPVIYEDNPVYQNLIGRIEHESRMGALITDFTHIKAGALHKANGGYLVLDVIKLLRSPFSWDALKRALNANKITLQSLGSLYGVIDTAGLEPEPIPLDIKLVLLGEREFYYLLLEYDPEFSELFKVAADFEENMERTESNVQLYARMIATLAKKDEMLAFDAGAVARVIEHAARLANDAEKLSVHMLSIMDLMQESEYWAIKSGLSVVGEGEVQQAIDSKIHRLDRIRDTMISEMQRKTILIDTEGDKTATVNGLAVVDLNSFRFAHPVRITATTRLGEGEFIDISREVELGGAIHSKGVLIISAFLASRYTKKFPLSLSASLTFEQSYGKVDGDSASLAELCALLSSLADAPVHQYLAVTGSVNQLGQVQAIGGVNEKIEGFFDICKTGGLNDMQGVVIPESNVKHLMLRHDIIDAVSAGKFHIYPVTNIDQAIGIMTGIEAGAADSSGQYPDESINFRVENKLLKMSETREKFAKSNHPGG